MKQIEIRSRTFGVKYVQVDDEDYVFLNRWRWHLSKEKNLFYAMRNETSSVIGKRYHVSMHRVIMGVYDPEIEIDHIDHNGLNNQKNNLRACTGDQNRKNRRKGHGATSKYIGVHLRIRKRKLGEEYKVWVGGIHSKGNKEPRKHFSHTEQGEIQAAKYYDTLAKKHYGEFANLNFKDENN